jgi:hypothetical protein
MNGYNNMIDNLGITYFNTTSQTSRRLLATSTEEDVNVRLIAMGYNSAHLIYNFNYMYLAIVGIMVIFGVVHLLGKCAHS